MKTTVEKLPTVISGIASDADVVVFIVASTPNADGERPTGAQLDAAANAARNFLRDAGFDPDVAANVARFAPVELCDGESLTLDVASTLVKTSPDPTPELDETSPEVE